jgi:hypothetical protein
MSLISKETLLTHLQRAEMASDVRLPIEFFRDLVYQAMPRTWVGLTDLELLMAYGWKDFEAETILQQNYRHMVLEGLRNVEKEILKKNNINT